MAEDYGTQAAARAEAVMREELESLRDRIIANHTAAGQRVTGRTAGSLRAETAADGGGVTGILTGAAWFGTLETGSRPWTTPHMRQRRDGSQYPSAPKWFIDVIRQWIADKGLSIDNPWGVATKIMTSGSGLFRRGGRTDIYSSEIEAAVSGVSSRLAGLFETQMVQSLLRE